MTKIERPEDVLGCTRLADMMKRDRAIVDGVRQLVIEWTEDCMTDAAPTVDSLLTQLYGGSDET